MSHFAGPECFWPYDSDQELYAEKIPPELGRIPSKWQMALPFWRFFHAENIDMVPYGYADPAYDDSSWRSMTVPFVWQTQGYGMASNLQYDAASRAQESPFSRRLSSRFSALAASEVDDDVGIYRTWLDIPFPYEDRAVYFCCSGIHGRFDVYVNGQLITSSSAIYTNQRFFLSPYLHLERNLLTILVYRLDGKKNTKIRKENGTFGFSGIFREPEIVAEPLLELTGATITTKWTETSKSNDTGKETSTEDLSAENSNKVEIEQNNISGVVYRRDASAHVRISIKNHTDLLTPIHVAASLLEARTEYDLYDLPIHTRTAFTVKGNVNAGSDLELETDFYAPAVMPWSDQSPHLYDLLLYLYGPHGHVICVKRIRFGFRTSETVGRVLHINEIPLPIRAVRYFCFDPEGGLSVRRDRLIMDILLMKQAGINTVICAHFPHDPCFYSMCDHYGLMVISQSERKHVLPMMQALSIHPSIVMWSFAPLTFDERKLFEIKQHLLPVDASRPFYCERDKMMAISDILPLPNEAGKLFGEWSDITLYRKPIQQKTGNGKSAFASIKGRAPRNSDLSDHLWIHQGDLEEYHEKYDVPIAQGIVSADRIPHPIYFEIKKQCETIQCIPDAEDTNSYTIVNLHPIGQTDPLILEWELLLGGVHLRGGKGTLPSIPPLGEKRIRFPIDLAMFLQEDWMRADLVWEDVYRRSYSKELVLSIHLTLKENSSYAPKGFETAFFQQVLLEAVAGRTDDHESHALAGAGTGELLVSKPYEMQVSTRPDAIRIGVKDIHASFSREEGSLSGFITHGTDFLTSSVQPSFYRPATNADRSDQAFALASTIFSRETDWREIQSKIRYKRFHYEMNDGTFSFLTHYKCAGCKGDVLLQYLLEDSGKLIITIAFTPKHDLLRAGIRMSISRAFRNLLWYGRGPSENYVDRKESGKIGLHKANPEELYHLYARPQENGCRCDTAYLEISDDQGKAVRISSDAANGFAFTATFYEPADIDDCMHQEELSETGNLLLFLDFYQRGIERTGKETKHFVKNRLYRGTFVLEPCQTGDPAET